MYLQAPADDRDQIILHEFLEEASELIEKFSNIVLKMEVVGTEAPNQFNECFRLIHTLKGSGACVGLIHLPEAAHQLETKLNLLRKAERPALLADEINELLAWVDFFNANISGLLIDRDFFLDINEFLRSKLGLGSVPKNPWPIIAPKISLVDEIEAKSSTILAKRLPDATAPQAIPLFFSSYTQLNRTDPEEISFALLSLSALALPTANAAGFSKTALDILRIPSILPEISRICLVSRFGLSNEYCVVSSASSGDSNPILSGSRCFVQSSSSLFKLRPGTMRVMNIRVAADCFSTVGLPLQRALGRLNEAGYQSGLCIAVGNKRSCIQALLFVNSHSEYLLNFPKEKFPILSSLASHAAKHALESECPGSEYFNLFERE